MQSAQIDPDKLPGYEPEKEQPVYLPENVSELVSEVLEKIRAAERPVLLVGTGVRLAGALDLLEQIADVLKIPVATAWTPDLLPTDNPYYCGRQGSIGTRAGNFTVQNADLVLILGARMCIRQVSYNWKSFARHAYKIQVDVDPAELAKPISVADRNICCEAKYFLEEVQRQLAGHAAPEKHTKWLAWCRERVTNYPPVLARQRTWKSGINPYFFVETLFDQLSADDVVVCGDATACIVPFQAAKLRKGQRLFSNSGCASMGYDLPAAIGAAVAHGKRTICLGGGRQRHDEPAGIADRAHLRLPLVIFVLNNGGYLSIRTTQSNFFGQLIGEGAESGVSFPDFVKVAEAHGLRAMKIEGEHFAEQIAEALRFGGPILCEVILDRTQGFEPKLSSKKLPDGKMVTAPLEDMRPSCRATSSSATCSSPHGKKPKLSRAKSDIPS